MSYKILEFIICDKYINKNLEKKINTEYYLFKLSQKNINIYVDKSYHFEYYSCKYFNIDISSLIYIINQQLTKLNDCITTINMNNKTILIEYNENNTLLLLQIIKNVIDKYIEITLKNKNIISINLNNMINSIYMTKDDNIIILLHDEQIFQIEINILKQNLFKCYYVKNIGFICGKIMFDNVFNHSKSLKNKIDQYVYQDYINKFSIDENFTTSNLNNEVKTEVRLEAKKFVIKKNR